MLTSRIACRSRHVSKKYGSIYDQGFHPSGNTVAPSRTSSVVFFSSLIRISEPTVTNGAFETSCNDIFAYICGITFGRTQLIKLSPKKTVEGFVGAWICTVIFGFFATNYLIRSSYFICPVNDLGATYWTGLQCVPNPVFTPKPYQLPDWIHINRTFWIAPMQFHMTIFATFASLIAPFGGFFASGLKRTFKIKDFGDSIPGHGGITDRMDCQFIMGLFAYMYYHSFIAVYKASVGSVMELAITGLTYEEQMEVVKGLSKYLYNQDAVSEKVSSPNRTYRLMVSCQMLNYLVDVAMYLSRAWEQHEEMRMLSSKMSFSSVHVCVIALEMTWNRT
jgi:CDP-diglyceride synthetase